MEPLYQLLKNSTAPITLVANGQSMLPAIQPNDQLVIKPCAPDEIQIGDIAAIYRAGALICHRILAHWRWNNWHLFFEKGDNQPYGKLLLPRNLIGKVVAINDQPPSLPRVPILPSKVTSLFLKSLSAWLWQTLRERQRTKMKDT